MRRSTLFYATLALIGLVATFAHSHVSTGGRPLLSVPLLLCAIAVMALREWMLHKK